MARLSKTSVCGQVEREGNYLAESICYGNRTRGVFGQVVERALGCSGADSKVTRNPLPGCAGRSEL